MKTYQSHKLVKAAKITGIKDGAVGLVVETDDDEHHVLNTEQGARMKCTLLDLGYLVEYEDGYISWSPTKAFEEGYTEVTV